MLSILSFAAVPGSLLLLIVTWPAQSTSIDPQPWTGFRIPFVDRRAHPRPIYQDWSRQKRLPRWNAVAIRKMSNDESEMFFPEYWQFEATTDNVKMAGRVDGRDASLCLDTSGEIYNDVTNASIPNVLQAPISLHSEQQLSNHPLFGRLPRALFPLQKRDFHCPSDTTSCNSIDRPNSCCATGTTCQSIIDTGQGDVGCCAQGQTCSGQVSQCEQGYTSCPASSGGGCCIPGYACNSVGCGCSQ